MSTTDLIHASIVALVILATSLLRVDGLLNDQEVLAVFSAAVGFAAGRSGTKAP